MRKPGRQKLQRSLGKVGESGRVIATDLDPRLLKEKLRGKPLKERIVREVGYRLSLEGASAADLVKSIVAKQKEAGPHSF